jgi:hypothetical protein
MYEPQHSTFPLEDEAHPHANILFLEPKINWYKFIGEMCMGISAIIIMCIIALFMIAWFTPVQ